MIPSTKRVSAIANRGVGERLATSENASEGGILDRDGQSNSSSLTFTDLKSTRYENKWVPSPATRHQRIQRRYSASDGSRVTSDDEKCGPTSSSRPRRAGRLPHRGGGEQAGLRWMASSSPRDDPFFTGTFGKDWSPGACGVEAVARLTGQGLRHPRACQYCVLIGARQMWRRCRRARDPTPGESGPWSIVPAKIPYRSPHTPGYQGSRSRNPMVRET